MLIHYEFIPEMFDSSDFSRKISDDDLRGINGAHLIFIAKLMPRRVLMLPVFATLH